MNKIDGIWKGFGKMHVDTDLHVGVEFVELCLVSRAHKGSQGVADIL